MFLLPHFLFVHVCGKAYLGGNTSEICCCKMGEDYVENQSFELSFFLRVFGLITVFIQMCPVLGKNGILAARWRHSRVDEYKGNN